MDKIVLNKLNVPLEYDCDKHIIYEVNYCGECKKNYPKKQDLRYHVRDKHNHIWPKGCIFNGVPRELFEKTK